MQLQPSSSPTQWQTSNNSGLCLQWKPISRNHSNSLESMESLENHHNQSYFDRQLSPVDSGVFGKRDSAYSSFSASSNTSDCTASMRQENNSSTDNIPQSLGLGHQDAHRTTSGNVGEQHKDPASVLSRPTSLTPSFKNESESESFGHEETRREPPRPPARKDSFRATRNRPGAIDKRCISAPVSIPSPSSWQMDDQHRRHTISEERNTFENGSTGVVRDFKCSSLEEYYTISSNPCTDPNPHSDNYLANDKRSLHQTYQGSPPKGPTSPMSKIIEGPEEGGVCEKHFDSLSEPDKELLESCQHRATGENVQKQFHTSDHQSNQPTRALREWSHPYLHDEKQPDSPRALTAYRNSGSTYSTLESYSPPKYRKPCLDSETLHSSQTHSKPAYGRSVSVPSEQMNRLSCNTQSLMTSTFTEQPFKPMSSTDSIDMMPEENLSLVANRRDEQSMGQESLTCSTRQTRPPRGRRRTERFATNLRNEIQRKKAELQKSKDFDEMFPDGQTMREDEMEEFELEEGECLRTDDFQMHSPLSMYRSQERHSMGDRFPPPGQLNKLTSVSNPHLYDPEVSLRQHNRPSGLNASRMIDLPPEPCYRKKCEEGSATGKARRWHWTPEHKLQPETNSTNRNWAKWERPSSSSTGVSNRKKTPSSYSSSSRTVECDILPFADRRRFFEETSRNLSQSVSNLSKLSLQQPKPERQWPDTSCLKPQGPTPHLAFRRFSYQGGPQQDRFSRPIVDCRRQFLNESQDISAGEGRVYNSDEGKELERVREAAREKMQELEKLKEREREMEQEQERKRERIKDLAREEWEREINGGRRVQLGEHEKKYRRENYQRNMEFSDCDQTHLEFLNCDQTPMEFPNCDQTHIEFPSCDPTPRRNYSDVEPSFPNHGSSPRAQYSQHPQVSYVYQINGHKDSENMCSAFYTVGFSGPPTTQQTHPKPTPRHFIPKEAYPEQEQTRLNRKFSLTERDFSQCRRDCRHISCSGCHCCQDQRIQRIPIITKTDCILSVTSPSPLRNRAMSESNLSMDQKRPRQDSHTNLRAVKEEDGSFLSGLRKPKPHPPPRPPPPKWNQYYQRRASHHSLFPSPTPFQSSPLNSEGEPSPSSLRNTPDMTRQRAYSLPPRDNPAHKPANPQCFPSPPGGIYMNRAFKPIVSMAQNVSPHPDPDETTRSLNYGTQLQMDQDRSHILKPVSHKSRSTAEWNCSGTRDQCSVMNTVELPATESIAENLPHDQEMALVPSCDSLGHQSHQEKQYHQGEVELRAPPPDLCARNTKQQRSPEPPEHKEKDAPIETDIDAIVEDNLMDCEKPEVHVEMQCFACPITVLEIDTEIPQLKERSQKVASLGEIEISDKEDVELPHGPEEAVERLSPMPFQPSQNGEQVTDNMPDKTTTDITHENQIQSSGNISGNQNEELNYKKQLMESLHKKLSVLQDAQRDLQEDMRTNAQLGEEIEALVNQVCRPNEVDKFCMVIGDLEKVVSLMLSLSGRLQRVESALDCLDGETGHNERLPLLDKKQQLIQQLKEAQELKEHVDRREEAVQRVLSSCLTPDQLRDYKHFVKMKADLLVEFRQLEDRIRLGKEQLCGLRETFC